MTFADETPVENLLVKWFCLSLPMLFCVVEHQLVPVLTCAAEGSDPIVF